MMESELFFCTLVLLGFGIAVFVLLLCQGLCSPPAAGVYILPVGIQPDMEYRLWLAESQVQLGRCGGVLLVEAGGSEETHAPPSLGALLHARGVGCRGLGGGLQIRRRCIILKEVIARK